MGLAPPPLRSANSRRPAETHSILGAPPARRHSATSSHRAAHSADGIFYKPSGGVVRDWWRLAGGGSRTSPHCWGCPDTPTACTARPHLSPTHSLPAPPNLRNMAFPDPCVALSAPPGGAHAHGTQTLTSDLHKGARSCCYLAASTATLP